jgi:predicted nucleic acid-binding protein
MNLIIDTSIVFSTLLNPNSIIGELFLNYNDSFTFFAPELLLLEIEKYAEKIEKYSKLNKNQLFTCRTILLQKIKFVSDELISENSWLEAYQLCKDIDENDTPFVALAIEMKCKLWSGDKKLTDGLLSKKSNVIFTTQELKQLISF